MDKADQGKSGKEDFKLSKTTNFNTIKTQLHRPLDQVYGISREG